MTSEDPYKLLTQSIKSLKTPLDTLLKSHDEFMLQNLSILNNVSSLSRFKDELQEGLSKKKSS